MRRQNKYQLKDEDDLQNEGNLKKEDHWKKEDEIRRLLQKWRQPPIWNDLVNKDEDDLKNKIDPKINTTLDLKAIYDIDD